MGEGPHTSSADAASRAQPSFAYASSVGWTAPSDSALTSTARLMLRSDSIISSFDCSAWDESITGGVFSRLNVCGITL